MKKLRVLAASLALSLPAWAANPTVEMKTNLGTIVVELDEARAPKTVANFMQYVTEGFYNGTGVHRVISD